MDFSDDFVDILSNLGQLKKNITVIQGQIKALEGRVKREQKKVTKQKKQRKKPSSGFAMPTKISDELCEFMGREKGTEMARTEVTKYLTQYIKKHNLQDEANRRKILPDQPLQKLLNVGKGDEVTYFNLQKYMKVHFPKPAVSA